MKRILTIAIFTLVLSSVGFSQTKLPVHFRVEKQSMSTPMTIIEDMFFSHYYITKPVNINFDGSHLNMYFDNGATFAKLDLTEVDRNKEYEGNTLASETILYTNNSNVSDTISFVTDYNVGYLQIVLPTRNSKGEYIGYTSYQRFVKDDQLALK